MRVAGDFAHRKGDNMVLHASRQRANRFGGETYTTVCGRMNKASNDGMNIANSDAEVTCKFCLRVMGHRTALAKKEG